METIIKDQADDRRQVRRSLAEFHLIRRRIGSAVITLLAARGREHLPAQPLNAMWQSAVELVNYFLHHPKTYFWNKQTIPAFEFASQLLGRSAGLLLGSMAVALLSGVSLGVMAAFSKRKLSSALVFTISILGISTPSFLLAMLFWVVNIYVHNIFDTKVLPSVGFGWDEHMVMPVLVLAMRPLAQLAEVTHVSLTEVLKQDYIRTAHAKGLRWRDVRNRHALRNIFIPIFTTLGVSLRCCHASLPVVELFFNWPGVGSTLFEAINRGEILLVVDLLLSFGFFFLFVNLVLEILFPIFDARITSENREEGLAGEQAFGSWLSRLAELFKSLWRETFYSRWRIRERLPALPVSVSTSRLSDETPTSLSYRGRMIRNIGTNPSLIFGSVLILGLIGLVIFGPRLTSANPYQTNTVLMIDREINAAPFKPSTAFPWGSDYIGRDVQALVFYGAKQTLTLAFFGMLACLLLGTFLGALAGWQQRCWLDRLVTGAIGVWAAFPYMFMKCSPHLRMYFSQGLSFWLRFQRFNVILCFRNMT